MPKLFLFYRRDPSVRNICDQEDLSAESFVRLLNRDLSDNDTKTIPKRNIERYIRALSPEASCDEFIRTFQESYKSPSDSKGLGSIGFFESDDGFYILNRGMIVEGENRKRYKIENCLSENKSNGVSYKAKTIGTNENVYIKTLSLTSTLSLEEKRSRVAQFLTFFDKERSSLEKLNDITGVAQLLDRGFVVDDFDLPTFKRCVLNEVRMYFELNSDAE